VSKPIRSIFFAPANQEAMLKKMPRANADVTIACLEDGTPVEEKVEARTTATRAFSELRDEGWKGKAIVRINPRGTEWFEEDIHCATSGPFDGLAIPKVGSADDVRDVLRIIGDPKRPFFIIVGIESGLGVIHIEEIFNASDRAVGAYFGAEDYATSIGATRSDSNNEVAYARARVALHAKVHNLNAFDCGTLAFGDDERFRRECREAKGYGFTGKICLHPKQVALANEEFMPSQDEIDWATRLLTEYNNALAEGRATPAIDGLMIDGPVIKRAEAILELASL
jgi:citrate lyase subunit beta/citryl-CoA lyase